MQLKKIQTILLFLILCVGPVGLSGQRRKKSEKIPVQETAPKLVVGIIVDQMRYDYLTRFKDKYKEGGFKRLLKDGFSCKNNHYNYAPTSTGPGHASVYSGATPSTHGIIGNNWYDKVTDQEVYCASDGSYNSVGTSTDAGKMSPHRMTVTTLPDQLRLHTQFKGKTIAVALKDRGAVLPGGHTANGAYWFYGAEEGNWITSSFYMKTLPKWVSDFNTARTIDRYKKSWNTLLDVNSYLESGSDANLFEGKYAGEETTSFPHKLPELWEANGHYDILKATPFGNNITTDFAIAAIEGEELGKDGITDFLALSYSSTDYVGHKFGVNSKEIEDTYLRLDQDLSKLLLYLDTNIGVGQYTVFLTADHAAINVPSYLQSKKIPAGYVDYDVMMPKLEEFLKYSYGTTDIVKNFSNLQFFLDHKIIDNLDLEVSQVQAKIAKEVLTYDGVDKVFTGDQMWKNNYTHGLPYILQNGFNQKRSGDILIVLAPGVISYPKTGSTHGSPQIYDTHVPLLFYGNGIKKGNTVRRTEITDIAPTIATLLGIAYPNGTTGNPIVPVLE